MSEFRTLVATMAVDHFPGLLGLLAVLCMMGISGAVLSRDRTPILMVVRGWALSIALAIIFPLAGLQDLLWVAAALVATTLLGALHLNRHRMDLGALIPSLALGSPLILLSVIVPSSYWDTYLHWLPNAQQVFQTNQLLTAPLPSGFHSMHPTYPPALAIPVYLASRITGDFASGAAQTLSCVLLVLSTQQVATLIAPQLRIKPGPQLWQSALIVLAAFVLLNPALHSFEFWPATQSLQFWSAIADPTVAILMVTLLFTIVQQIAPAAFADDGKTLPARPDPASLIALGVLLAMVKHSGWSFVLVALASAAVVAAIARLPRRPVIESLGYLAIGTAAASALWEWYLAWFLPLQDQFGVRDVNQWRLSLLPDLIAAIATVGKSHTLFYLLALSALVIGVRKLVLKREQPVTGLTLVIAISGLAFVGHVATLLIAYVGTGFEDWEIRDAHSWQRYASQAGFACSAVVLLKLMLHLVTLPAPIRFVGARGRGLVTTVTILIVAYIPTVRSSVGAVDFYREWRDESRRLATAALHQVPSSARLGIIGHDWSVIFANYASLADFKAGERPIVADSRKVVKPWDVPDALRYGQVWLNDPAIDCILVLDAQEVAVQLGLPATPDHLWCRKDSYWKVLDLGRQHLHQLNPS